MDPEVNGAPNAEVGLHRLRRGRSFRRYRAVARHGTQLPERIDDDDGERLPGSASVAPPDDREPTLDAAPSPARPRARRRVWRVLAPLAVLVVVWGVRAWERYAPVRVDPAIEQAIVAGDWSQVVPLAQAWHERDSACLTAALVAAEACTRLEELELMREAKRRLADAEAHGRPELWSCVRWARTLVRHQPSCPAAWCLAAGALMRVGEYGDALKAADAAIRLAPADARPYELRSAAHTRRHEYNEALANAAKAVELAPRDGFACVVRGNAFYDRREYDKAIVDYATVIGLHPQDAEAYADRGIAYEAKKEFDRAIADFTRAIELDPQPARAHSLRASAYACKGELAAAMAEWDIATALDPMETTTYRQRGYWVHTTAISDYTKAIELAPQSATAYAGRAWAHYRLYEYEEAVADYDRATHLDPWNAYYWYRLGLAHGRNGSPWAAISDFTKVIELDPSNADAYACRACYRCDTRQFERALADADRAIALDPKNTEAHYKRGAALEHTGQSREAILAYREALRLAVAQHLDATANDARNELRRLGGA